MPTIPDTFAEAVHHHRSGNLPEAEGLCRQLVGIEPHHPDAWHLLGIIAQQTGDSDRAAECLGQAIRIEPERAVFHGTLGVVRRAQGQVDEAAKHYRQAILLDPTYAEAHFNLGNLLRAQGRLQDATAAYRDAIRLRPDNAVAHNNLGVALQSQELYADAVDEYREAIRLKPDWAEPHYNLGNALQKQGKFPEACACYQQAIRLQPGDVGSCNNLGSALLSQGLVSEAIEQYRTAIRLKPDFAQAHFNLGNALQAQGRPAEAVDQYYLAIRLQPDYAEAFMNLGQVFQAQDQLTEATEHYEQAIRLRPDYAEAFSNLGNALHEGGYLEEARARYQIALRIKSDNRLRIALATMLPVVYDSMDHLLESRQAFIDGIRHLHEDGLKVDLNDTLAVPSFYLTYQGFNDRDLQRDLGRLYVAPSHHSPLTTHHSPTGRIRVGFFSRFFKEHSAGRYVQGLILNLSRQDFEVTILSVGKHQDAIARSIEERADTFVQVPTNLAAARRAVAEQQLDILVYTDVGMEPLSYTLSFSRLAPIQCATIGHPFTTGVPAIDYFLSGDLAEAEEADQHYTEHLVRLPNQATYYYRPVLAGPLQSRDAQGFSQANHIYACPQTLFKFHPEYDAILAGILRADPAGVLVLAHASHRRWEELLLRRFSVTMPDVIDRIQFRLPHYDRQSFLNLLNIADVQLDPILFGGGNSSLEGLALGTPVVTLPNRLMRGRMCLGMYRQMNMFDCVASTPQEYIDIAVKLGTDAQYRTHIRSRILATCGVLYEDMETVRGLERFSKEAVARPVSQHDHAGVQ